MISWRSDDGTLHLDGEGSAYVDTTGPDKVCEVSSDHEALLLHFCAGCKNWLEMRDGVAVHDDVQTVECVLKS